MKRLKVLCVLLFAAFLFANTSKGATATLLPGQSYQTEISSTGYHYLSIESVSSSNPSVSATKMGLVVKATVNAYFSGEATVTARLRYQLYAGQNYQYRNQEFTISCNETQISVSPSSISIGVGETIQLAYGFNRPTYITPFIQWTSSDETIATVSNDGIVTGVAEGSATIYGRSNLGGNTSQCAVRVNKNSEGDDTGGNLGTNSPDTSWYNSSDSEFELSTSAQLLGFRNLVNQGEHFKDKIIKLAEDIDLSSFNWTTPISVYPNVFEGTFDGNGHSITIHINKVETGTQEYFYFGFFGNSWGKIINLTMKGDVTVEIADMTTYAYVGVLCGTASYIESCVNEASFKYIRSYVKSAGNSDRIGGLAGNCNKPIINCINKGAISVKTKYSTKANTNDYRIGGIAGYGNDMTGCSNYGTIKNEVSGDADYGMLREYIGGITGWSVSDDLKRCSNFGNIIGNSKFSGVGGLVGGSGGSIKVLDSYIGKCNISNNRGGSSCYVNSVCGSLYHSNETFTNNFAASDINYTNKNGGQGGNTEYNSTQMQSIAFAEKLGLNFWIGVDGMYPIVKQSPYEFNYYITTVSNITCNSVILSSNVNNILASELKTWGFLLTLDDGKESYISGELGNYSIIVNGLSPDRNYKVRWYAQNKQGKEYYGVFKTFKTMSLNPITLDNPLCGVFNVILEGKSYFSDATKRGFYVQKSNHEDNGFYVWSDIMEDESFKTYINELDGNTIYNYCSVIEADGIIYNGDTYQFVTKSIATVNPSDYTDSGVVLNGEVGIVVSSAWFELRAESWPSVIESERVDVSNFNIGMVSAQSPTLQLNETYRYRLAADNNGEIVYGDWIEFKFEGEAGIVDIHLDNVDESIPVFVYNLSGQLIYNGMWRDANLAHGIYIVKQGLNAYKIRL